MSKARGQISFIDLNDGKSLALNLEANQPITQIFNTDAVQASDKYNPDYSVSPYLVISPFLFVSGELTNQISHIVATPYWTINGVPVNQYNNRNSRAQTGGVDNFYDATTQTYKVDFATSSTYALTIKSNDLMDNGTIVVKCALEYHDSDTGLDTPLTATMTFQQLSVAEGLLNAMIYSKQGGTIFRNKETEDCDDIVLHCDMYRGGTIDNTDVLYAWYRQDNPDDDSDDYNWYKIFDTVAHAKADPNYDETDDCIKDPTLGDVGYYAYTVGGKANTISFNQAGNEVTIEPDAVDNYDAFMCICTDNGSSQSTYGNHAPTVPINILDYTDPFFIEFQADAGTTMSRGTTQLSSTVVIYQNGEPLSSSLHNACTYIWTKHDKDGFIATGLKTSEQAGYMLDHKFKMNQAQTALEPDEGTGRWARQKFDPTDPNENTTYQLIATGSNGGRNLTVFKDEISVKGIFKVTVVIP